MTVALLSQNKISQMTSVLDSSWFPSDLTNIVVSYLLKSWTEADIDKNFKQLKDIVCFTALTTKDAEAWKTQLDSCKTISEKTQALISAREFFHGLVKPQNILRDISLISIPLARVRRSTPNARESVALETINLVSNAKRFNPLTLRPSGASFYVLHGQAVFFCQMIPPSSETISITLPENPLRLWDLREDSLKKRFSEIPDLSNHVVVASCGGNQDVLEIPSIEETAGDDTPASQSGATATAAAIAKS